PLVSSTPRCHHARPPPSSPTRRSSDLPVQPPHRQHVPLPEVVERLLQSRPVAAGAAHGVGEDAIAPGGGEGIALQIQNLLEGGEDRKSTRLNSSHGSISYAVFCLKKKT